MLLNTVSSQVPFGRATFTLVADWHAHYPLRPDLTVAPSTDFHLKGNSWGRVWEPLMTERLRGPPHRCRLDMGPHEGGESRHTGKAMWALASSRLACFSSVTAPRLQACCSSCLISTETYFGLLRITDQRADILDLLLFLSPPSPRPRAVVSIRCLQRARVGSSRGPVS